MTDAGTLLLAQLQGEEWGRKLLSLGVLESPKVLKGEFTFENVAGNEAEIGILDDQAIVYAAYCMVTTPFDSDDTNTMGVLGQNPPDENGGIPPGVLGIADGDDILASFGLYTLGSAVVGGAPLGAVRVGGGTVQAVYVPGTPGDGLPSQGAATVVVVYLTLGV